jgi:predicted acetyltransferase
MDLRDLDPSDLDAALDVRNRSFGPLAANLHDQWRGMQTRAISERRALAVYDGARMAGMARITSFRQWWLGRGVAMAGIGGVVVAPEYRGRGVAKLLLRGVLRRARQQGYALSALYPATTPLYRSVGWELAGRQQFVTLPAEALRTAAGAAPVPLRRAVAGDEAAITEALATNYRRSCACGPLDWEPVEWRIELDDSDYYAYLADDGFLGYSFECGDTLLASHAVAGSEATLRTMLAILGSGSAVAKTVRLCVAPNDPLFWLTREAPGKGEPGPWWMLRLVDAGAALATRGFPAGITAEIPLRLTDPEIAANAGTYILRVADGVGVLDAEDDERVEAALTLGPNAAAALYAGVPLSTLRRTGLVSGGWSADAAILDALFSVTAYCLDYF